MMLSIAIVATALALVRGVVAAPSGMGTVEEGFKSLDKRQGSPWQWWTEGQGQFSCQQQGGGKYSCTWNGKPGGGMVAGTGWGAGRK